MATQQSNPARQQEGGSAPGPTRTEQEYLARAEAAEGRCAALEEALQRYSNQSTMLENQLEQLSSSVQDELKRMNDEADAVEVRMATLQQQLDAANDQLEQAHRATQAAIAEKERVEQSLQKLQRNWLQCQQELQESEGKLAAESRKSRDLGESLAAAQTSLSETTADAATLTAARYQQHQQQADIERLAEQIGQLKAQLHAARQQQPRAETTQHVEAQREGQVRFGGTGRLRADRGEAPPLPSALTSAQVLRAADAARGDVSVQVAHDYSADGEGAAALVVTDKGVQRSFAFDAAEALSVGELKGPALGPPDSALRTTLRSALAQTGLRLDDADGSASAAARCCLLVSAAAPTVADAAFEGLHTRAAAALFALLQPAAPPENSASSTSSPLPAGTEVSVSLLDVYGDCVRDALAVRKAPASTASDSAASFTAPVVALQPSPAAGSVAATRVQVTRASDAALVVRTGLKSRALLYAAHEAARAATRAPHRGHAVAVLHVTRPPVPGGGPTSECVDVYLVAAGVPGWIASSSLADAGLSTADAASLRAESVALGRDIAALGDAWAARAAATAAAAGPAHRAVPLVATGLTAALRAPLLQTASPLLLHLTLPSRLTYAQDADAVAFLMLTGRVAAATDTATPAAAAAMAAAAAVAVVPPTLTFPPPPPPSVDPSSAPSSALPSPNGSPQNYHVGRQRRGSIGGGSTIFSGGSVVAAAVAASAAGRAGSPLFAPARPGGRRPEAGALSRGYYLSRGSGAEDVNLSFGTDAVSAMLQTSPSAAAAAGGFGGGRRGSVASVVSPPRSRRASLSGEDMSVLSLGPLGAGAGGGIDAQSWQAAAAAAGERSRRALQQGRQHRHVAMTAPLVPEHAESTHVSTRTAHGGRQQVSRGQAGVSRAVIDVDAEAGIQAYVEPKLRRLAQEEDRRLRAHGTRSRSIAASRRGSASGFVALEDYVAAAGPAAAAMHLVSPELSRAAQMQAAAVSAAAVLTRDAAVAPPDTFRTHGSSASVLSGSAFDGSHRSTSRSRPRSTSGRRNSLTQQQQLAVVVVSGSESARGGSSTLGASHSGARGRRQSLTGSVQSVLLAQAAAAQAQEQGETPRLPQPYPPHLLRNEYAARSSKAPVDGPRRSGAARDGAAAPAPAAASRAAADDVSALDVAITNEIAAQQALTMRVGSDPLRRGGAASGSSSGAEGTGPSPRQQLQQQQQKQPEGRYPYYTRPNTGASPAPVTPAPAAAATATAAAPTPAHSSAAPAAAASSGGSSDPLPGDPVPGMRALLLLAAAKAGGGDGRVPAAAFDRMRGAFAAADPRGTGRCDDAAFAGAVRRALPALSWEDVGAALHGMHLEGVAAIDYADFVTALQSLAEGDGLL